MTKQHIGIYAPYQHEEATQLACGLADFITGSGLPVSYLASGERAKRIHFRWDDRVRCMTKTRFRPWALQRTHIVWFEISPAKMAVAKACGCQNIVVPLWHRLQRQHFSVLRECADTVVAPSEASHRVLSRGLRPRIPELIPWAISRKPVRRGLGPCASGQSRVLLSTDGYTTRKYGRQLLSALDVLCERNSAIHVTLSHSRQWAPKLRNQMAAIAAEHHVAFQRNQTFDDRWRSLETHDWLCCFSTRPNSGCDALEALYAGCPVVVPNVAPYVEFVTSEHNGRIFRCQHLPSSFGAQEAQLSASSILDVLSQLLATPEVLSAVQQRTWPELVERTRTFQRRWLRLWDC